jgi:hypothetical protein
MIYETFGMSAAPAKTRGDGVVQRLRVGDEDVDLVTLSQQIKENPNTPWYHEYSQILLHFELEDERFKDMIDLVMGLGSMRLGGGYLEVDQEGYEADIEDNGVMHLEDEDEDEDPLVEEALINEFGLDSTELYRAEDLTDEDLKDRSKVLSGFFSTSKAYSQQYLKGGGKGNYKRMICVKLSKPIGNILIELAKSSDAFVQNAGSVGKALTEHVGIKPTQDRVVKARQQQGILGSKKALAKGYKTARLNDRSNAPNAVMVKQEPLKDERIANIEITSRLKQMVPKQGLVDVPHPLDAYGCRKFE